VFRLAGINSIVKEAIAYSCHLSVQRLYCLIRIFGYLFYLLDHALLRLSSLTSLWRIAIIGFTFAGVAKW
jgi:hypothetical protein